MPVPSLNNLAKKTKYHYISGGYTINNVALYASALIFFTDWLLEQTNHKDDKKITIPIYMIVTFLAVMLLISSWRSYYQVAKDYAEKKPPAHNTPPSAATSSCGFWNIANKSTTYGGAVLKASASSTAWFSLINKYNFPAAIITTLFFLPACLLSQFAFLGLEEKQRPTVDDVSADEENNALLFDTSPPTYS